MSLRLTSLAAMAAASLFFGCGGGQKTESSANPCAANPCVANANPCGENPCGGNPCGGNPCGAAANDSGVDFTSWSTWTKVSSAEWLSKSHSKSIVTGLYLNGNAGAYKALSGDPLPAGFAIVKAQHKNVDGKSGDPTVITVMVKKEAGYDPDNGDWYYGVFSYDGSKVMMQGKGEGKTESCSNCHTGAKHDYLYGSPN